jgi:hypothetical protein
MFKPVVVSLDSVRQAAQSMPLETVNNVFKVFHGYYGNLFLSKFSTGIIEDGDDQGIANARRIWAYGLRGFDAATVKDALRQCQQRHPEFPPSLPQFAALCSACRPREVYRTLALSMGQELRSQYARQARAINEKHAQKQAAKATGYREVPTGLAGLLQAVAGAVGAAGGDEAATLARLERELSQGAAA